MEKALTLKEVAALLGVSYSTVYEYKGKLGFFQIGNQWRVWPETLKQNLERRGKEQTSTPVAPAPGMQAGSRQTAYPVRAAGQVAVERELDELLAQDSRSKLAARLARKPPKRRS